MGGQADLTRRLAGGRVDQGERPVAVTDHEAAGLGAEADIVGIATKLDGFERRKFGALEAVHQAIAAVGHVDRIGGGIIGDALRFIEPADPAQDLAPGKSRRPGYCCRARTTAVRQVDREVVDAAADLAERNPLLQDQRLRRSGRGGRR